MIAPQGPPSPPIKVEEKKVTPASSNFVSCSLPQAYTLQGKLCCQHLLSPG